MKKNLSIILLASLLCLFINPIVSATVLEDKNDKKGTISVSTSANTEIAPNIAEISFVVESSDVSSMQKATQLNKDISDNLFVVLTQMIDKKQGDYIKTSDFNANPIYSYVNSKKTFQKYEVSNRVLVHTKSINNVGEMIDKAIKAGATKVDNLSFSVSDYETQCNDLISEASKKAKTRAEVLAKSISTSITGVNNIEASCSINNYNPPRLYMAKNMIADVASESATMGAVPISNGVIKVYVNINASFFVK